MWLREDAARGHPRDSIAKRGAARWSDHSALRLNRGGCCDSDGHRCLASLRGDGIHAFFAGRQPTGVENDVAAVVTTMTMPHSVSSFNSDGRGQRKSVQLIRSSA